MTIYEMLREIIDDPDVTVTSIDVQHDMVSIPNDDGSYDVERGRKSTVTFTIERDP